MPRSKKAKTQIIRVEPQAPLPDLATLDLLIQKRVAEATASQGAILEPWFQSSRALAAAIRRHESIFHKRKFGLYLEKWGCWVCGKKSKVHASHAHCSSCLTKRVQRLMALEKEYAKAHPQEYEDQQIENLTSRVRSAERILGTARPVIETPEEDKKG